MNPLWLLVLVFALSDRGRKTPYIWRPPALPRLSSMIPEYFDTFRMELMLDRMRTMTDALDKVNHLRQLNRTELDRGGTVERLSESIEVAKAFLADTKSQKKLEALSGAAQAAKQFTAPDGLLQNAGALLQKAGPLLQNAGPLLSAFSSVEK